MRTRETNIREYASQAEGRFLELLEAVMAGSPELFAPGDKTIAIGHISDMCADLFNEAIETAALEDLKATNVIAQRGNRSEGRV